MFGTDFRIIILILGMAYLIYYLGCKNIILEHRIQELECDEKPSKKENFSEFKKDDNKPKQSRELYEKINTIIYDKLGVSAREFILGK
jgi:hypothetical protein